LSFSISNLKEISSHPTAIIALVGILILVSAFIKIRKVKLTTKIIAQVGIALALSVVLQVFRIYHFPQGGSITFGCFVPIILISIIYGPEVGFLTGFLHGMLTLITDPYILHPVQVLFDYPLPSMSLALAGYFKNNKILGTFIALVTKYAFHVISGIVFFASYAPKGMSPIIYSLVENGTYMLPEGAICLVIITLLPIKVLTHYIQDNRALN
jgi:thiamine transporter